MILILLIIFSSIFFMFFHYLLFYIAPSINLIDFPNQRKLHDGNVPLIGGLSIFFSFIVLTPFLYLDSWTKLIFYASFIVLILGSLDDSKQLGVIIRLIAQLIACSILLGGNLTIITLGEYSFFGILNLGIFSILITLISVIGLTNAINFMDGIDGLASFLVLNAFFSIYFFSIISNNYITDNYFFIFSYIIFLFFLININLFPFKKVFLGDAGSMMLGFVVAWILIYYSHPEISKIHPVMTLWCVTLPVFDLIRTVLYRIAIKKNPFVADKYHIHHLLINYGYSQRKALILLMLVSVFSTFLGGFVYILFNPLITLLSFIICFFIYMFFISKFLLKTSD